MLMNTLVGRMPHKSVHITLLKEFAGDRFPLLQEIF